MGRGGRKSSIRVLMLEQAKALQALTEAQVLPMDPAETRRRRWWLLWRA